MEFIYGIVFVVVAAGIYAAYKWFTSEDSQETLNKVDDYMESAGDYLGNVLDKVESKITKDK